MVLKTFTIVASIFEIVCGSGNGLARIHHPKNSSPKPVIAPASTTL